MRLAHRGGNPASRVLSCDHWHKYLGCKEKKTTRKMNWAKKHSQDSISRLERGTRVRVEILPKKKKEKKMLKRTWEGGKNLSGGRSQSKTPTAGPNAGGKEFTRGEDIKKVKPGKRKNTFPRVGLIPDVGDLLRKGGDLKVKKNIHQIQKKGVRKPPWKGGFSGVIGQMARWKKGHSRTEEKDNLESSTTPPPFPRTKIGGGWHVAKVVL